MIERSQVALIRFHDGFDVTYEAWQSFWLDESVVIDGRIYRYQRFTWSGTTSGGIAANGVSVMVPNTPLIRLLLEKAMAKSYQVTFQVHQFDDTLTMGQFVDLNGSALVAECAFEVIGASGTMTELTIKLGAALSSIGAQFPPRTANTRLIGVPCVL